MNRLQTQKETRKLQRLDILLRMLDTLSNAQLTLNQQ